MKIFYFFRGAQGGLGGWVIYPVYLAFERISLLEMG